MVREDINSNIIPNKFRYRWRATIALDQTRSINLHSSGTPNALVLIQIVIYPRICITVLTGKERMLEKVPHNQNLYIRDCREMSRIS